VNFGVKSAKLTFMAWNDMQQHWYDDYERGRPGYPHDVIDTSGLPSSATVLDLGAGSGKLTRLLVEAYEHVIAVEPDDKMRNLFVVLCPEAELLAGSAEQIPLDDGSIDAVFAAQCFHNFDDQRALAEIARVLRPRGALVVLWNVPGGSTEPSIAAVERLLHRYWPSGWDPIDLGHPGWYASGEWRDVIAQAGFEVLQETRFPNPQAVDRDELVGFFDSMGWIAVLPDDERLPLLDEVKSLLTAPKYVLPWETRVHRTRLL
jgi:SAM-dependent methyltransferase